ncbi:hypothetical protein JZO70_05265 [Enterococcus sp. 669A]|uniref:Uncharacterized protein n=1 Tax=Candidatus Enterococcus moelleringii TaxID=2815325 RepID=A0ABS3L7F7_9ENTE|nr:hypothetical protein [Enterococcus sp. 669A]MBO1305557.1 hypothetical protein [Enterococcus sp. 669A]
MNKKIPTWLLLAMSTSVFAVMSIGTNVFRNWTLFSSLVLLAIATASIIAVYLIVQSFSRQNQISLLSLLCISQIGIILLNYLLYNYVGGVIQITVGLLVVYFAANWWGSLGKRYREVDIHYAQQKAE